MKKIAFFDAKPYDKIWFDRQNRNYEITYFEEKLNQHTARFTEQFDGVCAFVNDDINSAAIDRMWKNGIRILALRCAGYSNVDVRAAYGKIHIARVPAYSPHAVAEHAAALLLTLNRKLHKAYNRTRDFNFSLNGLTGIDLYGKTAGIIGAGKIGRTFGTICRGFGMHTVAYDPFPSPDGELEYLPLDELLAHSDVLSLHCPLNDKTHHLLNESAFRQMKKGCLLINTSRGALVETAALLNALNDGTLRGAGLDVYEEEAEWFFEDFSNQIITDNALSLLVSKPNVILTSHQAFLTEEALKNIADTTLQNLDEFFSGKPMRYEIGGNSFSEKTGEARK